MRALLLATGLAAGCVRAPSPIDVKALIAKRGPEEAHRDLAIRVLDDPRDVQARLGLAALAEQLGRPSEAIEQLEAVERLGGPIGIRWHDEDKTRLGRLLLARGRARLARSAPTALADLERAGSLGAAASAAELDSARAAIAGSLVRYVDSKVRAKGRAMFATLAKARSGSGEPTEENLWLGARDGASPAERGAFGAWLWTIEARRESFDQLAAWHAATQAPRDEALQAAYLRAYAWWVPLWLGEAPPPAAADLVGAERCRFPGADCVPPAVDEPPLPPLADADMSAAPVATLAVARFAATRSTVLPSDVTQLRAIAAAYTRDPSIAERLGRDLIARSADAALGWATLGALFDAVGDRPRARTAWQEAAQASEETAFVRGLAEATGRAGDGPAALVFATQAGASSGDPAVVWNAVAIALRDGKQLVDALTAARNALDLAGPDELPRALDLAIELSRSLGREEQANGLALQRAQVAIALAPRGAKPAESESMAALLAHRAQPTAVTTARLWVVARTHPRDVEVRAALLEVLDRDDARRAVVLRELLELAGDASSERALAAVAALRGH